VIVVDVNLLIYAVNEDAPMHSRAKRWWESAVAGPETVGLTWSVLLAFLRLSTRPGAFRNPLPLEAALDIIDEWLAQVHVTIVEPAARHRQIFRGCLSAIGIGGNLVSDAHLAAIAVEHNATLYSSDADFSRFPGLRWRNPLDG
jgi:toxin-antitoxin system PIN domain toxin